MTPARLPRLGLRLAFEAGTLVALGGFIAYAGFGVGRGSLDGLFQNFIYNGLIGCGAAACFVRACQDRRQRAAWLALGLAVLAFLAGELHYTLALQHLSAPPYPSLGDAFFLAFYPASYVGLILSLPRELRRARAGLWLDGLVSGLALLALAVALLLDPLVAGTEGSRLAIATTIAYPLGDFILLAFILGVLVLSGWRPGRAWGLIASALALIAVADVVFLYQSTAGTYVEGRLLDALWPASMLMIGYAALQRLRPGERLSEGNEGQLMVAMPALFGLLALGLLVYGNVRGLNRLGLVLATGALVAMTARMALSFRDNLLMVRRRTREAMTDALTRLGNRRQLLEDLDLALERGEAKPSLLLLFDLDGFKRYNDTYGHPAGDALLARLGQKFASAAVPFGSAYRLGGDEFCALVSMVPPGAEAITASLRSALHEEGRDWDIGASYGSVVLPHEADDAALAMQIADQRMYDQKGSTRRASVGEQTTEVLLQIVAEREPELRDHSHDVAHLARRVGKRFGLEGAELDDLARAAQLHDIGKMGIPDAILRKPGPLDESEWEFMRQHTLIGERMLNAAPSLAPLARLVRASHERWDGTGYPDGLAGEEIPLASRIIAVCDAFHAMISERPYGASLSKGEAMEELRHGARTQFDERVVTAFTAELHALPTLRPVLRQDGELAQLPLAVRTRGLCAARVAAGDAA